MPNNDAINTTSTQVEEEVHECTLYWCRTSEPESEMVELTGGYWLCSQHSDRAIICESCSDVVIDDDAHAVGYDMWCTDCCDNYAFWCEDCCEYAPNDYAIDHQHNGDLLEYNDTPPLVFYGNDPHGYFLGLELEMEDNTGCSISSGVEMVSTAKGLGNHFFCKSDGSLYDGMEMVSHPMTLAYWQSKRDDFAALTSALRSLGMRSWDTDSAGIHVHVSASAFDSDRHLWLFQQMFYRNPDSIAKYAGRESQRWARIRVEKGDVTMYTKVRKDGRYRGLDRYMAVNLTNSNTIEVRVFRGSLNPNRVYANLELVHALVEYTRTLTFTQVQAGGLDFPVFAYWLRQQPQYANAAEHVRTRGLSRADDES